MATALAVRVLAPLSGVIPAVTLAILGMCALGTEVLRRAVLYGRRLRPVRAPAATPVPHPALPAAVPRAIEAAPAVTVTAVVLERNEVAR